MSEPPVRPRRSSARWGAVAVVLALGAGAFALYGIGGRDKAAACEARPETLAAIRAAAVGELAGVVTPSAPRPLPAVSFKDENGADVGLDRFRGKIVLLNLWATWCAPCRREMPALDALEQQKGGADFAVVPVSFDLGSADKPKAFLKEIGAQNLPLYADPSGKMLQTMKSVGRGSGLPTTLILDRSGCEIAYLPGPAEWASAEGMKLIDAALGR
ncbi:thiol:disulfide interchange protein TlpA [Hansschlegelia beijingensis]|uniref:Thiol-disulfide isomerase/thioredoxin n=1 Tax=Hansschlegelia beijingensis TaxID=1133344 RepID=A0A7W6CXU0_9HYPH|nr:TlpA family protein disulfide reductase [Hansschlegelia beijingensis]MBB3973071.1 thiol-disulfide isomerase/thioredoxin [Hansschlegelia beijingensis]